MGVSYGQAIATRKELNKEAQANRLALQDDAQAAALIGNDQKSKLERFNQAASNRETAEAESTLSAQNSEQTLRDTMQLNTQTYGQDLGKAAQAEGFALDKAARLTNPNAQGSTSYNPNDYASYKPPLKKPSLNEPPSKAPLVREPLLKKSSLLGMKRGGFVKGKQKPNEGDNRKANIQTGEYVLPRKTTAQLGKENLDRLVLGTTGKTPLGGKNGAGYALGGMKGAWDSIKGAGTALGEFIDDPIAKIKSAGNAKPSDSVKFYDSLKNAANESNKFLRGLPTNKDEADATQKMKDTVKAAKEQKKPVTKAMRKVTPTASGMGKLLSRLNRVGGALEVAVGAKDMALGREEEKDAHGNELGRGGRLGAFADALHGGVRIANPLAGLGVDAMRYGVDKIADYANAELDKENAEKDRINAAKLAGHKARQAANKATNEAKAKEESTTEAARIAAEPKPPTKEELKDKEMEFSSSDTPADKDRKRNYFAGRTAQRQAAMAEATHGSNIKGADIKQQKDSLDVEHYQSKKEKAEEDRRTRVAAGQASIYSASGMTLEEKNQAASNYANMNDPRKQFKPGKKGKKAVKHFFRDEPATPDTEPTWEDKPQYEIVED